MKRTLIRYLACPKCSEDLQLIDANASAEIDDGTLACSGCGARYDIVRGIPRFVKDEGYARSFGHQWNKYARLQLDSRNGTTFSRDRFYSITEWHPDSLEGRLVLDVGCGAGRFAEIALEAGAEVIALDLSTAVDACQENLGVNPKLHCVQGSIFELPFKASTFDYIYCIGVIQHTPDPACAVDLILQKVRKGGSAGFWIYELSWKSFIGTVGFKYMFRPWTKSMTPLQAEALARWLEGICWPITRIARRTGRIGAVIMRMLPVSCAHLRDIPLSDEEFREWVRLDTFDMYTPAHDHPQRFATVASWLERAGFRVDRRHPHGAISITGSRG